MNQYNTYISRLSSVPVSRLFFASLPLRTFPWQKVFHWRRSTKYDSKRVFVRIPLMHSSYSRLVAKPNNGVKVIGTSHCMTKNRRGRAKTELIQFVWVIDFLLCCHIAAQTLNKVVMESVTQSAVLLSFSVALRKLTNKQHNHQRPHGSYGCTKGDFHDCNQGAPKCQRRFIWLQSKGPCCFAF